LGYLAVAMWLYLFVFIASFLVDLLPFIGPPAWTVMVFFQMHYGLNIWFVLIAGVIGSTLGRYTLSQYIPWLSDRYINVKKNDDLKFIGQKLSTKGWQVQLFVLLYTLTPLSSTPLFTAAGMARIRPMQIIPAFFVGKFVSDTIMVMAGDYVAQNSQTIFKGLISWQSFFTILPGLLIICVPLFIDWRVLLEKKKFRLNFHIWK
jgi:membrane protein YqaA with SNARE-associated domain